MQNLVEDLRELRLYGMAETLPEVLAMPRSGASLDILLNQLIRAEQTDRQVRSLQYQMKVAKFHHHRDLAGFDFVETPLEAEPLCALATGYITDPAHNLILIGGTGTGKAHLSIALGMSPVHQGKRVRFFNVVDLVNLLIKEQARL